tara:strand:+ start:1739 stop:2260 length:522 start_codon:yes stop_codon:yes gene_type:complete
MVKGAKKHGVGGNRSLMMSSAKLNQSQFPNGKIWMFYNQARATGLAHLSPSPPPPLSLPHDPQPPSISPPSPLFQWTSKATAFIVHMNWLSNGHKKKHRLVRDDMWFLDADDTRCAAGFDPLAGDCQRFCVPVASCVPGSPCAYLTNCAALRAPWHNVSRERCEARRTALRVS